MTRALSNQVATERMCRMGSKWEGARTPGAELLQLLHVQGHCIHMGQQVQVGQLATESPGDEVPSCDGGPDQPGGQEAHVQGGHCWQCLHDSWVSACANATAGSRCIGLQALVRDQQVSTNCIEHAAVYVGLDGLRMQAARPAPCGAQAPRTAWITGIGCWARGAGLSSSFCWDTILRAHQCAVSAC